MNESTQLALEVGMANLLPPLGKLWSRDRGFQILLIAQDWVKEAFGRATLSLCLGRKPRDHTYSPNLLTFGSQPFGRVWFGLWSYPGSPFSGLVNLIQDLNLGWLEAGHVILQISDTPQHPRRASQWNSTVSSGSWALPALAGLFDTTFSSQGVGG